MDTNSDLVTSIMPAIAQPTWPTDTDIVYIASTMKVILSNQGPQLHSIIQSAFKNIHSSLLFKHLFPDTTIVEAMVMKAVFDATYNHIAPPGQYNSLMLFIHQCLLSHVDYWAKICHLMHIVTSSLMLLIKLPAMGMYCQYLI